MLTRIQKGSSIYAVYELSDFAAPLDKVSIMMINHNQNDLIGLAPITLEEMNGNYTHIMFDVTGKVTLSEYVSKNISQNDFKLMLLNLIESIEQFDEYMIDIQQVMLDLDAVYINVFDHSVSFLCIALKGGAQGGSLYQFLRTVVEKSYVSTENNEISYFNRVWNIIRSENGFSLKNMKLALTDQEQSSKHKNGDAASGLAQTAGGAERVEEPSTITVTPKSVRSDAAEAFPSIVQEEKKKGLLNFFSFSKKKSPQPSGFQGGLAGFNNGKRSAAPKDNNNLQQIPVGVAAASSAIPGSSHMDFGGTSVLSGGMAGTAGNSVHPKAMNSVSDDLPEFQTGGTVLLSKEQDAFDNSGATVLISSSQDADDSATVLLEQDVKKNACLIRARNHERIFINKPMFMIGRDTSGLDYCVQGNSHVGRRHSCITEHENKFFITDLNSTNHTYVNGIKIQSNVETELSDGDAIRLADEEFEFRLM